MRVLAATAWNPGAWPAINGSDITPCELGYR